MGTGQSALEAHNELTKLQGRFAIRVLLSDVDVEKVVREVVLRKSADQIESVKNVLDTYSGEIDRHLAGTRIGPQPADIQDRVNDYPLLPVRRRLWEEFLRAFDTAGTAGQLRTQLRIVHEATKDIAEIAPGHSNTLRRDLSTDKRTTCSPTVHCHEMCPTRIDQLDDGTEEGQTPVPPLLSHIHAGKTPAERSARSGSQGYGEHSGRPAGRRYYDRKAHHCVTKYPRYCGAWWKTEG